LLFVVAFRASLTQRFFAGVFFVIILMTKGLWGMRCTICSHPDKLRIELLRAAGSSLDSLAAKFDVSRDAIHRHWRAHVSVESKARFLCGPGDLATLAEKATAEGDSVLDYLRMCRTALVGQLAAVTEAGDARSATYVAGQLTRTLETIARVTGEIGQLAQSLTINNVAVMTEPEFVRLQATLLRALAPFPDARAAVVQALNALEANNAPASPVLAANRVIEHVSHI
jgi:hypothetical protein